jgi:hypothetical protein
MANDPDPGNSLGTQGQPTESQEPPVNPSSGPLDKPSLEPAGPLVVLAFEAYFLLLGVCTAYALWTIWPYKGAATSARVFGLLVDFKSDPDARLLILAMLAGILGALVHVTTSFATYLGNRELDRSWVPWFALRPLIGMTLGLLFYLIVRAGFVTSNGADSVNPFGVTAISGLAGLFSKQTVDKLRDIFEHAFPVTKGGDAERRGQLKEGENGGGKADNADKAGEATPGKNATGA